MLNDGARKTKSKSLLLLLIIIIHAAFHSFNQLNEFQLIEWKLIVSVNSYQK